MLDFFKKLYEYDGWAVSRSLESLKNPANSKALLMLSHVLIAEKIWLLRLRGQDSSHISTFEEFPLEKCLAMAEQLGREYAGYLNSLTESSLDELVTYKNTKGHEFQTPVREILTHVGMHGVYHRGQIALLVRDSGGTAISTDFINFTRI